MDFTDLFLNSTIKSTNNSIMNISANDLKTRGAKALSEGFQKDDVLFVEVRGKKKYVVLPIETYSDFREYELLKSWEESKADIAAGRYKVLTVEEHIKELKKVIF